MKDKFNFNLERNDNNKEINERIRKKIEIIFNKHILQSKNFREEYHRIITQFCKKLEEKYGQDELLKYSAYHILIGSTPIEEQIKDIDLPGEDSIEQYLDKTIEELGLD
ncbi:MAG: hypothetical protein KatS3mg094_107 [Candidatus Parcubacteria bacterium]|nr:MAG: hypothetical protein KatS3mg094_107 [Candidatus Parcubacteria bacterium]